MLRRRAGKAGVFAALAALTLAGCGSQSASPEALAVVDGHPITQASWRTALASTEIATGTSLPDHGRAKVSEVKALVRQQVVVDYAMRHHLVSAAKARQEASTYITTQVSPRYGGKLSQALAAKHLSQAAFSAYVTRQMILNDTFASVTKHVAPVSQAAISQYYTTHLAQFKTPATVQVRHILVKTRQQAVSLLAQIKTGANFAALAERYSLDASSAKAGGSIGFVERGKASGLLPNFYKTMDALKPGQYGIAHTRLGYHIIEVQAVKPGSEAALSKVQPIIAAELATSKKTSTFDAWAGRIQRAAKVKILNA